MSDMTTEQQATDQKVGVTKEALDDALRRALANPLIRRLRPMTPGQERALEEAKARKAS